MKTRIVLTIFWVGATVIASSTADHFYIARTTNLTEVLSLTIRALETSFVACFWVFLLTRNDMIFGWVRRFLNGLAEGYQFRDGKQDAGRTQTAQDMLKPLISCEVCVGTNIGFWIYVAMSRKDFILLDFLFYMALTGLITLTTTETWQKATKG